MFGNATALPSGRLPANGFEALRYYDGNQDRKIDAKDVVFEDLRLWYDRNRDGESSPDELTTLQSRGVQSISLRYSYGLETDFFGNQSRERSVVTMNDQSKRLVVDVWFLPREE